MEESFNGQLLEYPQYTRPEVYDGMNVPEILLSGHHENIRKWRLQERLKKTLKNRPDLLKVDKLEPETAKLLDKLIDQGVENGFD